MARRSRTHAQVAGSREAAAIAATLGGVVRAARGARRWTLGALARKVGIGASRLSELERGLGTRAPLETWIALGVALERPLAVVFTRSLAPAAGTRDAGHLEIQEFILRLAHSTGRPGTFELPTRPTTPRRRPTSGSAIHGTGPASSPSAGTHSATLGRQCERRAAKSSEAAATWPEDRVATVWVVRATAANRALVARYPHIVDAAFPGRAARGSRP